MTLYDTSVGDSVVVISITGETSKRLIELGFVKGATILILNKNLLGGRIILFRNALIAIRDSTAKNILVNLINKKSIKENRQNL